MDKITLAKELLKSDKEDLQMWCDIIEEAPNRYVGKTLERELKQAQKFCDEYKIIVEALEKFIKDTEDFEKFDADMSKQAESEEREQERQADNAQEHAQEMRAQYEEELRSEGTDN
jgi:hypothetical protein